MFQGIDVIVVLQTWVIVLMSKYIERRIYMNKSKLFRALALAAIVLLVIYFDLPLELGGVI